MSSAPAAPEAPAASVPSVAPSASVAAPSANATIAPCDAGDPLECEARQLWEQGAREDVVYVPTPQKVVDKMLEVAKVQSGDVVYDLGCGDGRIVVTAAKSYGVQALGFDLNPDRVREARENVRAAGVESRASIKWANVFSVDLQPATVVTLYLLPELNVRLLPKLEKLRPGARVVSHDFDIQGVVPDGHWTITAPEFVNSEGLSAYKGGAVPEDTKHYKERKQDIYLWVVPFKKVAGR
ncbi:MAG TPA: class I SAM-dependent methyltransferase [Polyangiaceae bacterium]|nr:class I SAM-dependent methyltransferase [Polyangiaceae bacterium]